MIISTTEMKYGTLLKKKSRQAGDKPGICVLCDNNYYLYTVSPIYYIFSELG